jgi:hypothetical protein
LCQVLISIRVPLSAQARAIFSDVKGAFVSGVGQYFYLILVNRPDRHFRIPHDLCLRILCSQPLTTRFAGVNAQGKI